jgi:hypothetical protein
VYTVARLFASSGADLSPADLAAAINKTEGREWVQPRSRGDGFAAEVSAEDAWELHLAAMSELLEAHGSALRAFTDAGGRVDIDTLVGPEDLGEDQLWITLSLPPPLSSALAAAGATMAFTVTAGATGAEGWST